MQSIAIDSDFKSKTSHGVTTAESAKLDFGYKLGTILDAARHKLHSVFSLPSTIL